MADTFLITVHLNELVQNFNRTSGGRKWTREEPMQWLEREGINTHAGMWICEEISLGLLAKSEYTIVKRL